MKWLLAALLASTGDIIVNKGSAELIGGILNSSLVVLSKFLYGRPVGNEGNLKTEVIDVKMMPVPSPVGAQASALQRVAGAFRKLTKRRAAQFLSVRRMRRMTFTKSGRETELDQFSDVSELEMDDRRELDDAVLEMVGIKSQLARKHLIDLLYSYLGEFFESVRQKEEKAIVNKNKAKRKATLSPPEIANEILAEIKDNDGALLRAYGDFVDTSRPYSTFDLPTLGTAEVDEDIFAPDGSVRFMKGRKKLSMLPMKRREQANLVASIAMQGVRGLVRVPLDPQDCMDVKKRFDTFIEDRTRRFRSMIEDRTGDPDLQEQIFDALIDLVHHEANT